MREVSVMPIAMRKDRVAATPWAKAILFLKKQGLGTQRIAKRLGVNIRTVNRWVAGAEPRPAEKERLVAEAEALRQHLEHGGENGKEMAENGLIEVLEKARRISSSSPLNFDRKL